MLRGIFIYPLNYIFATFKSSEKHSQANRNAWLLLGIFFVTLS